MTPISTEPRRLLRAMFDASVDAALPARTLAVHLPDKPHGRTIVIGAGKASAAMARAVEDAWTGSLEGLVVTRYGHGVPCRRIEIVEAAHPVPDAQGLQAAERILALASGAGEDDLIIALISGGGSSLLTMPAKGLSLADKQSVNRTLLRSGASIQEMNCVRKHLSAVKGGRLAAVTYPARMVTLLISDVPGDDPSVIASGPTVADPTTFQDARDILRRYDVTEPASVLMHLEKTVDETPKPGDVRLSRSQLTMIATPQASLEAAAVVAIAAGVTPIILGDAIEGEAREVGKVMAAIAMQVAKHGQPAHRPCVLLSSGETSVTMRGAGRGGRNAEFLLALTIALDGHSGISAIACDTDGIDGSEDNAGAITTDDTLARARTLGLSARSRLEDNDGYGFFAALNDLVVTGPTLTNVNDFRAILVL